MKKFVFTLFAFVTLSQTTWAQGFIYDIWIDDRSDAMVHGMFTPGENELTLDLSAVTAAGLHFLNIIPYYEWGEMGQWKCIPFYMPEGWPHTTNAKWIEYWVTGYDREPKRVEYTGTEIPFDISVVNMSYGLHFLNVRAFNEVGEPGPWKQIMFYISNGLYDSEVMDYEYWIDDQEEHVTATGFFPISMPLNIDVSSLSVGKHTFYFKAKNGMGGEGPQFSLEFEIALLLGDADGDGTVDVNDVTTTINYILKKPYTNFIMEAADVDGDKTIDVNDVQGIIDIALGKTKAAARKMEEE